jgi:hypothetical protein
LLRRLHICAPAIPPVCDRQARASLLFSGAPKEIDVHSENIPLLGARYDLAAVFRHRRRKIYRPLN